MRSLSPTFVVCLYCLVSSAQVGTPTFPSQSETDSLNVQQVTEIDTPVVAPPDLAAIEAELDSLKQKYRKKLNLSVAINNHYTALFGQPTSVWGGKIGIEVDRKYRMGVGGYFLPRKIAMMPTMAEGARDSTYRKFRMYYFTTFMEFIFINNWRWELALPFSLGYGVARIEQWNPGRKNWFEERKQGEFLATVAVAAHYRIFSWVGVGFGLGLRQILNRNEEIQTAMSGLTLSMRLKLFPRHLYLALFKREKIKEEKRDHRRQKELKKEMKRLRRGGESVDQ